jgi:hypothetical protein
MAVTALTSIRELGSRLENTLNNPASYRAVCTRLLLRTGVNVREPRPEQDRDSALVAKVHKELADMGYQL